MGPRRVSKVGPITIHEYADETNELVAKSGRLNRAVAGTWTVTGYMDELVCLQKQTADNSRTRAFPRIRALLCVLCTSMNVSTSASLAPTRVVTYICLFWEYENLTHIIKHTVDHSSFHVTFFFHDYARGVFKRITETWQYKRFMKEKWSENLEMTSGIEPGTLEIKAMTLSNTPCRSLLFY